MQSTQSLPVIDIRSLVGNSDSIQNSDAAKIAKAIGIACRENGFFYVTGHGVSESLQQDLEKLSKQFFSLDENEKMKISMKDGGKAWRGYFPVGGELTSGKPDLKEGLYFGSELSAEHPKVKAGVPLHGKNLFPEELPAFKKTVLQYMDVLTKTGHALMKGIALSLGLPAEYFHEKYTADPFILFRIFHYPAQTSTNSQQWGVGEHTDYGILTILKQDDNGGLQVKSKNGWIDAPPIPGTFVCNIGDMLDRMTGGLYRSTPHRVLNTSGKNRLSYPFFFDPNFDIRVQKIENLEPAHDDRESRWDKASVHDFEGTYGDYILRKVEKVFPGLRDEVL